MENKFALTFGETEEKDVSVAENAALEEEMELTAEEAAMIENFASQIDLSNINGVLTYGATTQKKMSGFSEETLRTIKSKDLGEVGNLLGSVVTNIKSFDEEEKGLFGLFKKGYNKLQAWKTKYDSVSVNINKICDELEGHKITLMKDIADLDNMYKLNLEYFKELTMYIAAGKKKLSQVQKNELVELRNKAIASGKQEDAQVVSDLEAQCNRFEKKLYDLELTRTIAMQTAPQIRMVQNNDSVMIEKITTIVVNTIPLWKNQMILALGVENSKRAMEDARKVTDATNELLKKNADTLKQSTVDIAKESERGIVDIETLEYSNKQLISTIDEVIKIQEDGKKKREEAEERLVQIENELKHKMLEVRK
ncbi:uncharacterized protein YaaN involved in tellurite resistance [Lachnospiraceae bacterium PF1-22]